MAVDSEALFKKRALSVGLLEEDVLRLSAQGWRTYGTFAMASEGQPGQVADDKFNTSVIAKVMIEGSETRTPCLKRLYLESYSATLADMKRTVEATNDDVAVKVPEVEKMSRMENFQKKYPGAKASGVCEPASSLIDEYIHMVRHGAVRFLDWSRLLSREDEIKAKKHTSLKGSSVKWEARSTGLVAVAENSHDAVDADLGSDYLVRVALHRRSVAVHVSGLCDFVVHEQLVDMYFERRYAITPSGYKQVSLDQVKAADEAAWKLLADLTRGGTTGTGSSVFPASDLVAQIMKRAEVELHLRPLPGMHVSVAKPPAVESANKGSAKKRAAPKSPEPKRRSKVPKMPTELSGHHAMTTDNVLICFAYNMRDGCPSNKPGGSRCSRGLHVCCHRSGCEGKHPFYQHKTE